LHRRSQYGYTDRLELAMRGEPEAVDPEVLEQMIYRRKAAFTDRVNAFKKVVLGAIDELSEDADVRTRRCLHNVGRGVKSL
jgi:hypothetical protein